MWPTTLFQGGISSCQCAVMGRRWKSYRVQLKRSGKWLSGESSCPSADLSPSLRVVLPSRAIWDFPGIAAHPAGNLPLSRTGCWSRSAASSRWTMIPMRLFRLALKYLLIWGLCWSTDLKWFPELTACWEATAEFRKEKILSCIAGIFPVLYVITKWSLASSQSRKVTAVSLLS